MAASSLVVIILMALLFGAELGPKADPTTTTYTPRPEWYFFFLFELLRVVKPPALVFLATIGIPTICLVLLLLLPFFDRGPERHPLRRPIATTAGIATIGAMAYLTRPRRARRAADGDRAGHDPQYEKGKNVTASSGCLGCHKIGENGNTLGPNLTEIGARLGRDAIARTLVNPTAPMPSYATLREKNPEQFDQLVQYLASLKGGRARARDAATAAGTLPETQVRAMFDRIAGVYDRMNSVMTAGMHHRWRERAADLARVAPGERALDVATGTGDLAVELERRGAEVVGIDFSEGMLELARDEGARAPLRARATRWRSPYADGEFDAATVGFGARNFSDLGAGPGGDGARRAPRRARRGARDHDPAAAAAVVVLPALVRPRRAAARPARRRPGRLQLPAELGAALPRPARPGGRAGGRRPRRTCAGCSPPAASSPSTPAPRRVSAPRRRSSAPVLAAGGPELAAAARAHRGAPGRGGRRPRRQALGRPRRRHARGRRQAAAADARVPLRAAGDERRRRSCRAGGGRRAAAHGHARARRRARPRPAPPRPADGVRRAAAGGAPPPPATCCSRARSPS